jgi:hypothetical protein
MLSYGKPIDFALPICYNKYIKSKEESHMTINQTTANFAMDAMAFALTRSILTLNPEMAFQPDELVENVEALTRNFFIEFCDMQGIDEIEEEDEDEPDFPDDVDESNYDPYMGCDCFECDSIDEGW